MTIVHTFLFLFLNCSLLTINGDFFVPNTDDCNNLRCCSFHYLFLVFFFSRFSKDKGKKNKGKRCWVIC